MEELEEGRSGEASTDPSKPSSSQDEGVVAPLLAQLHDPATLHASRARLSEFVSNMGDSYIADFLDLVSEFSTSRIESVTLVGECVEIYKESFFPHLSKAVPIVIRSLSSAEESKRVYETCSDVISKMIRSTPQSENRRTQVLDVICYPLASALTEKPIQLSEGSAHCLESVVKSDAWLQASEETQHFVSQQLMDAIEEPVYSKPCTIQLALAFIQKDERFLENNTKRLISSVDRIIINYEESQTCYFSVKLIQELLSKCNKNVFYEFIDPILMTLETLRQSKNSKLKKQSISSISHLTLIKNHWKPWKDRINGTKIGDKPRLLNSSNNHAPHPRNGLDRQVSQNLEFKLFQDTIQQTNGLMQETGTIETRKPIESHETNPESTSKGNSTFEDENGETMLLNSSIPSYISHVASVEGRQEILSEDFLKTTVSHSCDLSSTKNSTKEDGFATPLENASRSKEGNESSSNLLIAGKDDKSNPDQYQPHTHSNLDSNQKSDGASILSQLLDQSIDRTFKKESSSDESDFLNNQTPVQGISREEKLMNSDPRQILLSLQSSSLKERIKFVHPSTPDSTPSRPLVSILKSHKSDADVLYKSLREGKSTNVSGNWSGSSGGSNITEKKNRLNKSHSLLKKKKSARFQGKGNELGGKAESKEEIGIMGRVGSPDNHSIDKKHLLDKNSVVKKSHDAFHRSSSIHSFSSPHGNGGDGSQGKGMEALDQRPGSGSMVVAYVDDCDDYTEEAMEKSTQSEKKSNGNNRIGTDLGDHLRWAGAWEGEGETDAEETDGQTPHEVPTKRSFLVVFLTALLNGFEFICWGTEFFLWVFVVISFSVSLAFIVSRMEEDAHEWKKDRLEYLVPT